MPRQKLGQSRSWNYKGGPTKRLRTLAFSVVDLGDSVEGDGRCTSTTVKINVHRVDSIDS